MDEYFIKYIINYDLNNSAIVDQFQFFYNVYTGKIPILYLKIECDSYRHRYKGYKLK